MKATLSLLSPTEMTTCLQAIAYCLVTCRPLLSAYERELVTDFVTMLAASMVKQPEGPITISLFSTTKDAITELHVQNAMYAVMDALKYMPRGGTDRSSSEPWSDNPRNTSPDTQRRTTQQCRITQTGIPLSIVCPTDRE